MGSTADVIVVGPAPGALVDWAQWRIEQLEQSWSRFRADSELNAVLHRAGSGPVPASEDLIAAIGHAVELWYVTDGCFDVTIRAALESCGYDRTFRDISPDPRPVPLLRPAPGCEGLGVDRTHRTVTAPRGVGIDLGGLGKGLAADLSATGLVARGAFGACVALGGDVRACGCAPDGDAWVIPIEDPLDESRVIATRSFDDAAVVTSTTRFRRWIRGGDVMHHLIDPATGAPAQRGVAAVVAQAESAWWAEGVAKAALVAGAQDGVALLERLGVAAIVVGADGTYTYTSKWTQP
jgi:thiamine biosynthesis lipoprotein